MMYGFDGMSGWWLMGMSMMVIFWLTIVLLGIWVVRNVFPRQRRPERDQTLEILRQRYAAGEINEAEYERARARLEQTPAA